MPDVDLDGFADDTMLRESLGRLAATAGQAASDLRPAPDVRRRGVALQRRRTAGAVLGVGLALLALAGVVGRAGVLRTAPEPAGPTLVVTPSPAPTASPPPTGASMVPGGGPGSEFGELTAVRDLGDGRLEITFDAKTWLRDKDEYDAYVRENGQPDDCEEGVDCRIVLDDGEPPRTLVLGRSVHFRGTGSMLGEDQGTSDGIDVNARDAVANLRRWLSTGGSPVPVWVFHTTADLSSPVVAVYEQYFP
jgi:hypothetical protein